MASITFTDYSTAIPSSWLNDVNTAVYTTLALKAPLISPSFTTPTLGVATATSINGLTFTASTGTITITNGKTLTMSNTLTFSGTDGSTLNIGTGGTLGTAAYTAASAYTTLAFKTIAVSGQSNVVASNTADTLTMVGGSGITVTTNAGTNTITVTAASGSPGGSIFTAINFGGF